MSIADLPPEVAQQIAGAADNDPDLLQKINDNPELLAQILANYDMELGAINDEQAMAQQLRGRANTDGIQAGNQFVAASPLSHIADAGNNFMAGRQEKQAADAKRSLGDKENERSMAMANILRGAGSSPMQQVPRDDPQASGGGAFQQLAKLFK